MIRNVTSVLGTATFSQVIVILASPILSRVYSPVEFGVYIFIMTVVTVMSPLLMFRFENALVVSDEIDFPNIIKLCLDLNYIWFFSSVIFIYLFSDWIISFSGLTNFGLEVYCLPFLVIVTGLSNLVLNAAIVDSNFKGIGINKILVAFVTVLTQVVVGYFGGGAYGLIIGSFLGYLTGLIYMSGYLKVKTNTSLRLKCSIMKKYNKFPKYDVPSSIFNLLSLQLPNLSIGNIVGSNVLGHYAFTSRVMMMPINLIGQSVGVVFKKHAVLAKEQKILRSLYVKTSLSLFLIGFIPFSIIYMYGDVIFSFVFGDEWRDAGLYASILVPMLYSKFIVSPISFVLYLYGKQKLDMLLQLLYLIVTIYSIYILYTGVEIVEMLEFYALSSSLIYLLYFVVCYNFTKRFE